MSAYRDDPSRTSVTAPPGGRTLPGGWHSARAAALLEDLAAYHADLTAWAETHPGEQLPPPVLDISSPGAPQQGELADLRRIAAGLGVEVRSTEDGTRTAEPRFGPVIVKAAHPGRARA